MLADRSSPGLSRAIIVSAGAHVAAFAAALLLANFHPHRTHAPENVLVAKLVRLGQEKPANFLPRKVVEVPESAAPVAIAERTPVASSSAPKETLPSAKERIKQLAHSTQAALERLKQQPDEVPEGRADGVRGGDVADAAHALAGNLYVTEIMHCLQRNYSIFGTNPEGVKNRSATVFVRIERDGHFIESRIERSSGLPAFDQAVERALKLCGKVSPPPEPMRERVRSDGIEVEFQP
jgi:TonB family protein